MAGNNINKLRIGNRDEIYSPSIDAKGFLHDKHGINSMENSPTKFPSNSLPLWWKKINGAKSYALMMESYDATKLIGLPFVNWIVVNINENSLDENQSVFDWAKWTSSKSKIMSRNILWQGLNSSCIEVLSKTGERVKMKNVIPKEFPTSSIKEASMYFGPSPKYIDSLYVLKIYGLDCEADKLTYIDSFDPLVIKKLNEPYYAGDFIQAISNHIVGTWTLCFKYKKDDNLVKKNNKKSKK